tara:strand:+ start:271 stop:480 length:210 start_codon:yes stop_codon:yes gene_type:complete
MACLRWLLVAQEPWWACLGHWHVSIELAHCLGPLSFLFRLKDLIFFSDLEDFKKSSSAVPGKILLMSKC